MKGFALFAFVVLAFVMFAGSVFAEDFVIIDRVEVNDQVVLDSVTGTSLVQLEREQDLVVEVFFRGNPAGKCTIVRDADDDNPCYDTRVEAEIEGYEYGDVRDVEGPFEVEPGVSYRKVLRLRLPEDMPAGHNFNLNIEVKDSEDVVLAGRVPVRIQEIRHRLNIFDVVFNPIDNVMAGQPLFATVRLENLGDNVESSVKVTVAVPALGIQTSEFVDQLSTELGEEGDGDADDAATTDDLLLIIPADAEEGDYDVVVMIEYNRGRSVEQRTFPMHVRGSVEAAGPRVVQESTVVNVDAQAQRVNEGEGAVFKFSVGNLGQQASSYTFEIVGASDWANTRVDPTGLVVQSDSSGEAFVYVAPKEDVTGIKSFTVRVMSGSDVVAERNLSVEVLESERPSLQAVLTWIFVVLLVVLVILVVVVLVRKRMSASEASGVEGQTYY